MHVESVDFFTDPFSRADVITMSLILHDWNLEKKLFLMRKPMTRCHQAGA